MTPLTTRIADARGRAVRSLNIKRQLVPKDFEPQETHPSLAKDQLIIDMADEIARLTAEVEKARQALLPFVVAAKGFDHPRVKNPDEWMAYSGIGTGGIDREGAITVTHLRTAARVHADLTGEKEKE